MTDFAKINIPTPSNPLKTRDLTDEVTSKQRSNCRTWGRRLKLSQELRQIGQFFLDLFRLRMAAVETQCRAPGVICWSLGQHTGQLQWTTGDRFSFVIGAISWTNKDTRIHDCRHSGGDRVRLILSYARPNPSWFQFRMCSPHRPDPDRMGTCAVHARPERSPKCRNPGAQLR